MSDVDYLVGKKITKIELSEDKSEITFFVDGESPVKFNAHGDCCSTSWIENIEEPEYLIGNVVTKVVEKDISRGETEDYECLDIMNIDIYTDKGICTIDFRNSSNGYYGGSLERVVCE